MAEPMREKALAAIADLLATQLVGLRPLGWSYPNPVAVTRRWQDIKSVTQFPTVIVLEGDGTSMSPETDGGDDGDDTARGTGGGLALVHRMAVDIRGYVKGDHATPMTTWRARLWDDVAKTLLKYQRLGEQVRGISFGDDYAIDAAELEPLGAFRQQFIVTMDEPWEIQ